MPYDPDLSRSIDRIRLSLADTDDAHEWLPDVTYEKLLVSGGASLTEVDAYTEGVARTAAGVIARLLRRRPVKRTANGELVDYTGQAEAYEAIAAGETALPLLAVEVEVVEPEPAALPAVVAFATVAGRRGL